MCGIYFKILAGQVCPAGRPACPGGRPGGVLQDKKVFKDTTVLAGR